MKAPLLRREHNGDFRAQSSRADDSQTPAIEFPSSAFTDDENRKNQ